MTKLMKAGIISLVASSHLFGATLLDGLYFGAGAALESGELEYSQAGSNPTKPDADGAGFELKVGMGKFGESRMEATLTQVDYDKDVPNSLNKDITSTFLNLSYSLASPTLSNDFLSPYIRLSAGLGQLDSAYKDDKIFGYGYGIGVGTYLKLSDAFEVYAGYDHNWRNYSDDERTDGTKVEVESSVGKFAAGVIVRW